MTGSSNLLFLTEFCEYSLWTRAHAFYKPLKSDDFTLFTRSHNSVSNNNFSGNLPLIIANFEPLDNTSILHEYLFYTILHQMYIIIDQKKNLTYHHQT